MSVIFKWESGLLIDFEYDPHPPAHEKSGTSFSSPTGEGKLRSESN